MLVLLIATAARADIDLTGSWTIAGSFFSPTTVAITQSGSVLTIGSNTGTIDPLTGSFMVEYPPQPGGILIPGYPYGPSPPGSLTGTAAPDGNSFEAYSSFWIIKTTPPLDFEHFPWFLFGDSISGERRDLSVCGNGQIDAREACDDGDANGANDCCTTICTLVDTDNDETCDAVDDCPFIYDYIQSCAVPLTLTSVRASAKGLLRARGTLAGNIGSFAEGTLSIGGVSYPFVIGSCRGNPPDYTRVRCASADGQVRLQLWRRTFQDEWHFRLSAFELPGVINLSGPLSVEIIDHANSRIAKGAAETCVMSATHVSCQP
jgi:hypothetical protein